MSFPSYPEYKDSGVEWLGEVPAHWSVRRLKQVCQVFPSNVDKKSYDDEDPVLLCNYTDVYYNEEIVRGMDFMAATASRVQVEKFTLLMGDTIITKDSETADDIAISAYVPETLPGVICGYHLSVVRPMAGVYGRFVKSLFDSQYLKARFAVSANGLTRVGLSQYALDNVDIPFPPMEEQKTIAQFIDAESLKIDGLIAEQKKLIALLKEKRQAVISHAVTKGLNPSAPMRDSGIEWLGEVPAHWEVTRLSRICSQINDINHEMPVGVEDGVPFLSAKDLLDDGTLNFIENVKQISEEDFLRLSKKILPRRGDIIYSRIGACLGKARLVKTDIRFLVSYSCCVIRVIPERADLRFMQHLLDGDLMLTEARMRTQGIGVPDLGLGEIGRFPILLPTLREQIEIADYLDAQLYSFDELSIHAEAAVALLKERRSSLISAAVTGKIDVRQPAAAEAA